MRRQDESAFYRFGHTFFVEEGNERFADAEFGNRFGNFDIRVAAEGFGSGFNRFLVARCEGAQGVLHAVTQLAENGIGQVERVLGNKIYAHAFGTDQAHDLFDLFDQRIGGIVEHQMRFVEEHHEFWFVQIADFGQGFKQLRQHPQQKRAVHTRRAHQFFGVEDVDDAFAVVGLHPVLQVEGRLAEEFFCTFVFQSQQLALNRADTGGRNVAVLRAVFRSVVGNVFQHAAQVF